jgi:hypothetical protein
LFCSTALSALGTISARIGIIVSVVEVSRGNVETTSITMRVDGRVFLQDMNLIVPMAVVEVVSETGTASRGVWAAMDGAGTDIQLIGETNK